MPNYQNGKIYSLRSHQTDDIYIGSTTLSLSLRKAGHRNHYKRHLDGEYHFVTSFNITKFDDCYIELIENYPCNTRNELDKREGELIRGMDCVNKYIAGRTKKSYYVDNKEAISESQKAYYVDNKEAISEKKKAYYVDNKERLKEYREANKERLKEYQKAYRDENKEKLKEKYTCECRSVLTHCNKSRHEKSKKHQAYKENEI